MSVDKAAAMADVQKDPAPLTLHYIPVKQRRDMGGGEAGEGEEGRERGGREKEGVENAPGIRIMRSYAQRSVQLRWLPF